MYFSDYSRNANGVQYFFTWYKPKIITGNLNSLAIVSLSPSPLFSSKVTWALSLKSCYSPFPSNSPSCPPLFFYPLFSLVLFIFHLVPLIAMIFF